MEAKVLEMKYENSDITMMIILPNKNDGLSALESKISQVNFQDLAESLEYNYVDMKLPKFKIEFNINMNEPLKKVSCSIFKYFSFSNINMF